MSLSMYTTEEIKAEIRRRKAATPTQKAREALGCTLETVEELERRAGLPRWQCEDALHRLAMDGEAEWTVRDGVILWRRMKN